MKIKINYEFDAADPNPFFATTELDGRYMATCSDKSFDEARERLISRIEKIITEVPTVIPEPEEVEIGDTETTCPECSDTGEVDEEIKESFASQRISPRYKKVKCEACEDGKIKEN